jgi:ATP-dependent Lon protease
LSVPGVPPGLARTPTPGALQLVVATPVPWGTQHKNTRPLGAGQIVIAPVAMFTALVSLLTGRTVRSDTAMTGEISLRGLVLPIGGVKEKVLATTRAGITTVLLPSRNQKDLEDVPETARNQVRFVWLDRVDDAIAAALAPAGEGGDREVSGRAASSDRQAARAS